MKPSTNQGRPTMATLHNAPYRKYEDREEMVARFETAIVDEGLIANGREAVNLLTILAKAEANNTRAEEKSEAICNRET